MKTHYPFRIILACGLLLSIAACATYPKSGQTAVVGTWTNSLGTVWTARADGTFTVAMKNETKPHVWGKYTVAGDTITIQETGGKHPKGCKGPGVYKFTRPDKNTLQFTLVKDACKLRKENVLAGWHQK